MDDIPTHPAVVADRAPIGRRRPLAVAPRPTSAAGIRLLAAMVLFTVGGLFLLPGG